VEEQVGERLGLATLVAALGVLVPQYASAGAGMPDHHQMVALLIDQTGYPG